MFLSTTPPGPSLMRCLWGSVQVVSGTSSVSSLDLEIMDEYPVPEELIETNSNLSLWFAEEAKANAPCVIFIDELDSVGGKRVESPMHPYSRQTINQLLAEMDGSVFCL